MRFPDGSIRRPDIAMFCQMPERMRTSTTLVPEAVIEIVSPASVVKDVTVYAPETEVVEHIRRDDRGTHRSPVDILLERGCLVTL